ncbi:hypothetical protein BURMUCF2_2996, partial [Burkholderia multivorans CF2]
MPAADAAGSAGAGGGCAGTVADATGVDASAVAGSGGV